MRLSKKQIQELKNKKISIEELNDKYFINSENEIEVGNILKVLNENICSFEEIVDKFKNIRETMLSPCLYLLLRNKELFEELIKNNKLTKDDLKHLLNAIDNYSELDNLSENTFLLKYIIENDILSFKELVDKFKRIGDFDNKLCLNYLLNDKELFEELGKNNILNKDDLKYLLNKIDDSDEFKSLANNSALLKHYR